MKDKQGSKRRLCDIDPKDLAPVVARFAEMVRDRWPKFLDYATIDWLNCLFIEYPSPCRADALALWISADADLDEIIIGFGPCHSHGGSWHRPGDADFEFKSSIGFIDGILAERVVGCVLESHKPALRSVENLVAEDVFATALSVVSWRGTYDRC